MHRIGRTARAGADGTAVAFCAPAEMGELQAVEKLLKKPIPVIGGAPWSAAAIAAAPKPAQRQGQRPAHAPRPQGAKPQGAKPQGGRPQGKPQGRPAPQGQKMAQSAPRRDGGAAAPRAPKRKP